MTKRSVQHVTFTLERTYAASPAQVFAAWADPHAKRRWFADGDGDNSETLVYELDFRVGGRENGQFKYQGTKVLGNETIYLDIVPDRRIIFAYTMSIDEVRISASVGTVDLAPAGKGTRLIYTEQAAYLDGHDTPESREGGWNWLLDQLGADLRRADA